MAHGGPRNGSGRKKGQATKLNEKAREVALASGITPLDYMLTILRDNDQPKELRFEAAKAAAPYVHAKLAAVEHTGKGGGPIEVRASKEQRDAAVSAALRSDTDG